MTEHTRRAYTPVDLLEAELCDYTGAPYAVCVNSCTNALLLALYQWAQQCRDGDPGQFIELPRRTYVGVLQSALNAGCEVGFHDDEWQDDGWYYLYPTAVADCARILRVGMWETHGTGATVCLSFHAAKQLPLGRGGAILTDNQEAAEWFRAARMDGRPPGQPIEQTVFPGFHCPMPPDVAARGLDILSRWNDAGYSPPPLPATDYPDLSAIYPAKVPA